MSTQTTNALVLPVEAAASGEPQAIADFPGRWIPGQPYAPAALGLTEEEARDLLAKVDAPLVWVEVPDAEVQHVFLRAAGTDAPSGYMNVEAARTADARTKADPITTAAGDVIHPGVIPPVPANPSWVQAAIERDTLLSRGKQPDDARQRIVRAAIEEEVRGENKAQLEARAERLGIDAAGLKKDDLLDVVLEAELAPFGTPDTPPTAGLVEVQEPLDPSAKPSEQETDLRGVPAADSDEEAE